MAEPNTNSAEANTTPAEPTDSNEKKKEKKKRSKKSKRKIAIILVVVLLVGAIGTLLAFLTVNEYQPEGTETLSGPAGTVPLAAGSALRIATLNTGYGALSDDADFFMDGGSGVRAPSVEIVDENVRGIASLLGSLGANAYLLQEVDIDSDRSFNVNELDVYEQALGMPGIFAYNYNVKYVPYPIPTIGHVESGLATLTNLQIAGAERVQLPLSFAWPVSTCNLKRCLLVERIPIAGTDKELVLMNLHLEAYDDGSGKEAQTQMLREMLELEYVRGNYVIAGGDFNQVFEGSAEFPSVSDQWVPPQLALTDIPAGYSLAYDDTTATCRLLNDAYTGDYETSQVFVLDGFLVSDNVQVLSVETVDDGFRYTDHQPVVLTAVVGI